MNWPEREPRVVAVQHRQGYTLEITFSDGAKGELDVTDWVVGRGGVFHPLESPEYFEQVRLNQEAGTIEWPNGADFCPDVLYSRLTGIPIPFADQHERTSS
jgi:hypothetical protein